MSLPISVSIVRSRNHLYQKFPIRFEVVLNRYLNLLILVNLLFCLNNGLFWNPTSDHRFKIKYQNFCCLCTFLLAISKDDFTNYRLGNLRCKGYRILVFLSRFYFEWTNFKFKVMVTFLYDMILSRKFCAILQKDVFSHSLFQ